MTEQVTEHPEMRNTVFGEVLAELMESRGHEVTPAKAGLFAEEVGCDGWKVINRMASADNEYPGPLNPIAGALELSEPEKIRLALALAYEKRS